MLTEQYIFCCKLKGEPVVFDTSLECNRKVLQLLMDTRVWEKNNLFTHRRYGEYVFTILYPIEIVDSYDKILLNKGDYHTVCFL